MSAEPFAPIFGEDTISGLLPAISSTGHGRVAQETALGKRYRSAEDVCEYGASGADNGHASCPRKKSKRKMAADGVLVAAGSTRMAHNQDP